MTETEQVKALAELDGLYFGTEDSDREECWRNQNGLVVDLPNYLTSYDAIIPLIQKQDGETKNLVEDYIEECQTMKTSFWYDATPAQLREALLRATGKWKD